MLTCTKRFPEYPFAHRAPNHDGHCRLIHGHNWQFEIEFRSISQDANGFVYDFGKFGRLKTKFEEMFDHTLLLNESDPMAKEIKRSLGSLAEIRLVRDCSCEGIARMVFDMADDFVRGASSGRAWVHRVTVFEDTKNSATFVAT